MQFTQLTPVPIPSGPAVVSSQLTVNGAGPILWDLTLQTFITHTSSGDLAITLKSPAGTIVTITRHHGGLNDDVYNGTVWTDRADRGGQAPYTFDSGLVTDHVFTNGVVATPLAPQEPLGAFRGENPNGTWTLTISDDLLLDGGNLASWSLDMTTLGTGPGRRAAGFSVSPPSAVPAGPAVYTTSVDLTPYAVGASICDIDVATFFQEPANGDTQITLQSPAGTVVTLTSDNGGDNGNVFYGTHWFDQADPGSQVPYAFDNQLATEAGYTNGITQTPLVPEEPLSAFLGENPHGIWTLTIAQGAGAPAGVMFDWDITIWTCGCSEAGPLAPMLVDTAADVGPSNLNGVLEPGERVVVEPTWGSTGVTMTGFDTVTPPSFPAGWTAHIQTGLPGDSAWVTAALGETAPNAAQGPEPGHVTDNWLTTPVYQVSDGQGAQFTFRHTFSFETGFDGGVLEVAVNGGLFVDVTASSVNGYFSVGGYNGSISGSFGNPLAGQNAWTGSSGGWLTTMVSFNSLADGDTLQFRFRLGTDTSTGGGGWLIDSVAMSGVAPAILQGTVVLSGAAPGVYSVNVANAEYGEMGPGEATSCNVGFCYEVTVAGSRPATHWDATLTESIAAIPAQHNWPIHVGASFTDVPTSNQFYKFVETVLHNGVTGGCGGSLYCPSSPVTRAQMAVFLLKGEHGSAYVPPPATGAVFGDVHPGDFAADWIERLAAEGVTGGCGNGNYCPGSAVTRAQMAVFLLKASLGAGFAPLAATGVFPDVPPANPFASWIEELFHRGITGGCGSGNYCPNSSNTRGQMAAFLTKSFRLVLYGP
jgi:subtilisin-like proprotein convertase family protein